MTKLNKQFFKSQLLFMMYHIEAWNLAEGFLITSELDAFKVFWLSESSFPHFYFLSDGYFLIPWKIADFILLNLFQTLFWRNHCLKLSALSDLNRTVGRLQCRLSASSGKFYNFKSGALKNDHIPYGAFFDTKTCVF